MKSHLFLLATGICFFFLSPAYGQRPDYAEEAKELVRILKMENRSSDVFTNALERAITSYHVYHSYASEETRQELFDLLFDATHQFKDEYYSFLIQGRKSFSPEQLKKIKQEFPTMLDTSHAQFCDVVMFYRLYEYKPVVFRECYPVFYADLKNSFLRGGPIPSIVMDRAMGVAAFVGAEDVAIEDSLINLVNEFHRICQNTAKDKGKRDRYEKLYNQIVPYILARLKSKRSVVRTLHLILDDFEFEMPPYEDVAINSLRYHYLFNIILLKVSPADEFELKIGFYDVMEATPKEQQAYFQRVYDKIKNNQVTWKKTLIDVD